MTWMKILGTIVFSGSLAIDCIKQYNFNLIHSIPFLFSTIFLQGDTLDWIVEKGGWISIGRTYTLTMTRSKLVLTKRCSEQSELSTSGQIRSLENFEKRKKENKFKFSIYEIISIFLNRFKNLVDSNSNCVAVFMIILFILSLLFL